MKGIRSGNRSRSRSPSVTKPHSAARAEDIEMPRLDILLLGPSQVGKTCMMKAFARNEEQKVEEDPFHLQLGMSVTSQFYQVGIDNSAQTVKLCLWDPAMHELTSAETDEAELVGINEQLRVRYQQEVRFHGVVVCYDCTIGASFAKAVDLYKELIKDPKEENKLSCFSKIPVAFVGTKLDLTNFLNSEMSSAPRCVQVADVRLWLQKVHRRAENACFETSSRENIGVSIMVDWIVKAALRAYPRVQKSKQKKIKRFSPIADANAEHLKEFLGATGNMPFDQMDEAQQVEELARRDVRWKRYLRYEAQTAPHMKDVCSIQ